MSAGEFFERVRFAQAHRLLGRWLPHPLGHFYSPVVDADALASRRAQLWPATPVEPGHGFDPASQANLLEQVFPGLLQAFDYPRTSGGRHDFFLDNRQFGEADARASFALLRHWAPRRYVEVGSGFSTLLAADVNRRFLGGAMSIVAIEPYPRDFLSDLNIDELRVEHVQDTPLAVFEALEAGDILFIDSSHVLKTGSDLEHMLTRVLPRLAKGVRIHFHDVFLPDEYPPQWVMGENRSWNEQYALQAVIANGTRYRVLYATHFALTRLAEEARPAFGNLAGLAYAGGSFWIEVA